MVLSNLAAVATINLAHDSLSRGAGWETGVGQLDPSMFVHGGHIQMMARASLPSPDSTNPSDSECEIVQELERKRRQLDDEISNFQAQKEKEFHDFEKELRARKRGKTVASSSQLGRGGPHFGVEKPPSRTSSSSALDLLVGHGASQQSRPSYWTRNKLFEKPRLGKTSPKAGPSLSRPVVSLDRMNIKGETTSPHAGRPHTPPTPTLLSRTLTHSSSSSSIAASPSPPHSKSPPPGITIPRSAASPSPEHPRNSLTGLFTPSYLALLDANIPRDYESSSALITPPVEDETATAPSSLKSSSMNEVLPLTSSSFPPNIAFSPAGHTHASKRAYTAPTVPSSRKPSALRTASGGAISRKRKHVTFRLANEAIVEPSSSYEEGPSPELGNETTQSPGSGTRSPLRSGKSSLHRTFNSDEEDAEAGVQPGMGMGDVIQRLNDYTVAEASKHGEDLDLAQEPEDEDEEEDEDDDMPMEMSHHNDEDQEDASDRFLTVEYHEDEDEPVVVEDGYFSPKNKHVSIPAQALIPSRNSPLVPYRDEDWNQLSSSDKDRLLFNARRHSDESDDIRLPRGENLARHSKSDESGFSGGLSHGVDGGSGVGFFELDEELASPDAGKVQPFQFDMDNDLDATVDAATDSIDTNLTRSKQQIARADDKKRLIDGLPSTFGVGSVPIDIVRPSVSVSSSWIGTFGH